MSLSIGTKLGPYEVLAPLGAGGMGEVYRALDTKLGREVALKLLPAESIGDEAARARLVKEAKTASALNHPNICTIHDVGDIMVSGWSSDGRVLATGLRMRAHIWRFRPVH